MIERVNGQPSGFVWRRNNSTPENLFSDLLTDKMKEKGAENTAKHLSTDKLSISDTADAPIESKISEGVPLPWEDDKYNNIPGGKPFGSRAEGVLKKLSALRQQAKTMDYTGMSDVEIARSIAQRYDKAFDGNHSGAMLGGLGTYMVFEDGQLGSIDVYSQMDDEIVDSVSPEMKKKLMENRNYRRINPEVYNDLMFRACYGTMAEEERRNQIEAKYADKKGTSLEFLSYINEMCGARLLSAEEVSKLSRNVKYLALRKAEQTFGLDYTMQKGRTDFKMVEFMAKYLTDQSIGFSTLIQEFLNKTDLYLEADIVPHRSHLEQLLADLEKRGSLGSTFIGSLNQEI